MTRPEVRRVARKIAASKRAGRAASGRDWRYGTVTSTSLGTVNVTVDGNDGATPCPSTAVAVSAGDRVAVRVKDGRGEILRNYSDPAAGTSAVDGITSHFWSDSSGAHVTEQDAEDFLEDPTGYDVLVTSASILMRLAAVNLMKLTGTAIKFFDGLGDDAANVIASLGPDGSRIGYEAGFHTYMDTAGFGVAYGDDRLFDVSSDGYETHIYAGGSTAASGLKYTDKFVAALVHNFNADPCYVSGTTIYNMDGSETPYTISSATSAAPRVLDASGDTVCSAAYSEIYYNRTSATFVLVGRLSPMAEVSAMPFLFEFGGCSISASDGSLTLDADEAAWSDDVEWTALTLSSACEAYHDGTDSSEPTIPMYRRWGYVVNLIGAVKPTSAVSAGGTMAIGTMPAGCRPKRPLSVLCQGSSQSKWLLNIDTDGTTYASRYSTGGSQAAMGTSTWLPFNVTYMCA